MAYGVKYRLEFSDVNGYGKKVEILKKDYTGEVLPMIGTGNPVVVKWKSTDDFYKPIIGSSCVLNLMVTDTVQYDDFYNFDEKEYKIEVSFSKLKKQVFADRITSDNGIYESLDCIEDFIGTTYNTATFYQKRVEDDNGFVESLNCINKNINIQKLNVWEKYWSGFVVVDRFKEQMIDYPYKISLNAFDGLGTLSNYDAPLETTTETDLQKIYKILQNTSLDLDIVFANDLNFKNADNSISQYPNIKTINDSRFEFKDGFDTYTAKEILSHLLTIYNMRIFQSYNKFYIVENSNLFDSSVKKEIRDLNTSSNPPSNIRELITKKLKSLNNEFINVNVYDSNGVFQAAEKIATVKTSPEDLKPLKSDLTREFLQPLDKVDVKISTQQYEKTYYSNNPGFEFGTNGSYNWIIEPNNAEIVADEISKKGKYSIKLTNSLNSDFKCFTSNVVPFEKPFFPGQQTDEISILSLDGFSYSFSYFIESSEILAGCQVKYRIKMYNNTQTIYFNESNEDWQTSAITNTISVNQFNGWQTKTKRLKNANSNLFLTSGKLVIEIFQTTVDSGSTADYVTTYFDDIGFYQQGAEVFTFLWLEGIEKIITPSKDIIALRSDDKNYTSKKSYSTIMLPTDSPSQSKNWYRSRDYNLTGGNTTEYKKILDIRNQNIMNDFREACIRYEGTFRDLTATPLSLHNKVWFDWENVLNDKQATILDGLSYNLKQGAYKIVSHLPNDDNDLDVDIRIKA